jgi:hypothetical protein
MIAIEVTGISVSVELNHLVQKRQLSQLESFGVAVIPRPHQLHESNKNQKKTRGTPKKQG